MNIIYKLIAMLGGRSFDELKNLTVFECGTSITVGCFSIVSSSIIGFGQYLFWSHLPHTADNALWIALVLTIIYTFVYRMLMRSIEVIGRFGRATVYFIVAGIVSTNAMLASHEVVLLEFKPQYEAQAAINAAVGITEYGDTVSKSLGIPKLSNDYKLLNGDIDIKKTERDRIPEAVLSLRTQAQQCDGIAARLQALIPPDSETIGYSDAMSSWREQRGRCKNTHWKANKLLRAHKLQIDTQLEILGAKQNKIGSKLDDSSAEYEATLKRDTPTLKASATTGFARYKALWDAVEVKRIPLWAVVGSMFIAIALDGLSFVIKLFLKPDFATCARREKIATESYQHAEKMASDFYQHKEKMEFITVRGENRVQIARTMISRIPAAINSLAEIISEGLKADANTVYLPGIRTELAAQAFEDAHDKIEQAQHRTGKPSLDLLRRLASLGAAVRNAMKTNSNAGQTADSLP